MVFRIEQWPFDDPSSIFSRFLVHTDKEPSVMVLELVYSNDPTKNPEVMDFFLCDRSKYDELVSLSGDKLSGRVDLPLLVQVDRSSFKPLEPSSKIPSERWALVKEVFLSLDKSTRAHFQKSFRHYREGNEFKLTFLKHCLVDCKPVYYRFIFDQIAGPSEFDWKNTHFQFRHKGLEYYVEDTYCIEPSCGCNGILALFHSCDPRTGAQTDPFIAVISVEGKLRALSHRTVPEEEAKKAVEAFLGSCIGGGSGPRSSEELRSRWKDIREVGAKIASRAFGRVSRRGRYVCPVRHTEEDALKEKEGVLKAPEAVMAVGHFGRNDPCPCGSGQKYKRCCGAK